MARGKTRQTAGAAAAAAAAAAAVSVEPTDALVSSAACRRIVFPYSQLVGQVRIRTCPPSSLCAGLLPSRMRFTAGSSGPVAAFVSKQ